MSKASEFIRKGEDLNEDWGGLLSSQSSLSDRGDAIAPEVSTTE